MIIPSAKLVAFVPTRDFDRARAFYEGVLGLKFLSHDGFALVMETSGTLVRIAKVSRFSPAQFTILGWRVEEMEDAVAALAKRGVKFERFPGLPVDDHGIWRAPGGAKVAWFKDPDGNILSLSQHS